MLALQRSREAGSGTRLRRLPNIPIFSIGARSMACRTLSTPRPCLADRPVPARVHPAHGVFAKGRARSGLIRADADNHRPQTWHTAPRLSVPVILSRRTKSITAVCAGFNTWPLAADHVGHYRTAPTFQTRSPTSRQQQYPMRFQNAQNAIDPNGIMAGAAHWPKHRGTNDLLIRYLRPCRSVLVSSMPFAQDSQTLECSQLERGQLFY